MHQDPEAAGHIVSSQKAENDSCLFSTRFLFFIKTGIPAQGMVPPIVGTSSQLNLPNQHDTPQELAVVNLDHTQIFLLHLTILTTEISHNKYILNKYTQVNNHFYVRIISAKNKVQRICNMLHFVSTIFKSIGLEAFSNTDKENEHKLVELLWRRYWNMNLKT